MVMEAPIMMLNNYLIYTKCYLTKEIDGIIKVN